MSWFANLRIGTKLALSFGTLIVMSAALGLFSISRLRLVDEQSDVIAETWLRSVRLSGAMALGLGDIRRAQFRHILATNDAGMDDAERTLKEYRASLFRRAEEYKPLISSDEERALYESFLANWGKYREQAWPGIQRDSRALQKGRAAEALMNGESKRFFDQATGDLEKLVAMNTAGADAASAKGTAIYTASRSLTLGVIFACVLIGIVASITITRAIATPLRDMTRGMQSLAQGDLQQHVGLRSKDEVGELAESFHRIVASQQALAHAATRLAAGDTSVEVAARSERDTLGRAFVELRLTLQRLVEQAGLLATAAQKGKLATRGDAQRFEGAFRELVQGINQTLDAVIRPVREAGEVLERMAARDLTARVSGEYAGEHGRMKASIYAAATALQGALVDVATASAQVAAASGQIAAESQHLAQGSSEQASSLEEVSSSL